MQELEEVNSDPLKLKLPAYGRFGSPTSRVLEERLTQLEGGAGTVLTNCGLSAVTTTLMALLKSGDHVLLADSCYWPTRNFCEVLKGFGVQPEFYDPTIGAQIAGRFRPNTKLVFLESPGSLTFEMQDVPLIAKLARERGILTAIDNTWATPLFFNPLKVGVDVSIHAATKYITGHADSFLGAVICNEATFPLIRGLAIKLGQCASPEDVYTSIRGLHTLKVRLQVHQERGLKMAAWLKERKEVAEVLHPALPGTPGYDLWKRDFTGAPGLFSVVLKPEYTRAQVANFVNNLQRFGLGHSWGGYESLVLPAHPETWRLPGTWTGRGALVRIHAGLEDLGPLLEDLEQGFGHLRTP